MKLIKIEFTLGLNQEAYQVIDDNGNLLEYRDLDGSVLELPAVTESKVIDAEPSLPDWAV